MTTPNDKDGGAQKSPVTGFTLANRRHGPHYPQRLGFWWLENDDTHHGFEMAITDQHPELVAMQLTQLAEAIRIKHRAHTGRRSARLQGQEGEK